MYIIEGFLVQLGLIATLRMVFIVEICDKENIKIWIFAYRKK